MSNRPKANKVQPGQKGDQGIRGSVGGDMNLTLAELKMALSKAEQELRSPLLATIRVGSVDRFIAWLGLLPTPDTRSAFGLKWGDLMGVQVIEDRLIPTDRGILFDTEGKIMGIVEMK